MKNSTKFGKPPKNQKLVTSHNAADYERFAKLFSLLEHTAPPQVELVHRSSPSIHEPGKKLGIFSGSFNPLTVAHTALMEQAISRFQLDELLLLLAKVNVDKGVFGLPLATRLVMLKRYAEGKRGVSVGASSHGKYINKVTALNIVYPPQTELHFLVGYDTLLRIFEPKYYTDFNAELRKLFLTCHFIVANRAEADLETIENFKTRPFVRPYAQSISCIMLPEIYADISSTGVRQRLEQGNSIEHLVPPGISEFLT